VLYLELVGFFASSIHVCTLESIFGCWCSASSIIWTSTIRTLAYPDTRTLLMFHLSGHLKFFFGTKLSE